MKNEMIICLLLLCSMSAAAQQLSIIELWPGKVPGSIKEKAAPVKEVGRNDGVLIIKEVTNPVLEVIEPVGVRKDVGVIVCPGGGYGILAYDLEGTEIAQWLAKQGITAFVLSYRVPQQREGALQDLQRAIRIVRDKYGFANVGVIGFSAGGSLSARAVTRFNEELYPKVDTADKKSARPDFGMLIYPAYLDEGTNRTLTPELSISSETSPIFLFATADDSHCNSSLVMTQALRNQKVPVELHVMPIGGHGYGLRAGAGLQWTPLAEDWLKNMLPTLERKTAVR